MIGKLGLSPKASHIQKFCSDNFSLSNVVSGIRPTLMKKSVTAEQFPPGKWKKPSLWGPIHLKKCPDGPVPAPLVEPAVLMWKK